MLSQVCLGNHKGKLQMENRCKSNDRQLETAADAVQVCILTCSTEMVMQKTAQVLDPERKTSGKGYEKL